MTIDLSNPIVDWRLYISHGCNNLGYPSLSQNSYFDQGN